MLDSIRKHYLAVDKQIESWWLRLEHAVHGFFSRRMISPSTFPGWYQEVFRSLEVPQYIKAYLVTLTFMYLAINVVWSIYYIGCAGLWRDRSFGVWHIIIMCVNSAVLFMYGAAYVLVHHVHGIKVWDVYHWKNIVDVWTMHASIVCYHCLLVAIQLWDLVTYGVTQDLDDEYGRNVIVYRSFSFALAMLCMFSAMITWLSQRGLSRTRALEVRISMQASRQFASRS